MKQFPTFAALIALLAGCSVMPPEAYYNRADPESLLDVSSEVVNLPAGSDAQLDELTRWIERDQPSRAELYCPDDTSCASARDVLDLYGVPTVVLPSQDRMVSLVYERVLARDCENRFIDNSINPYNLHHPTYGCSTALNMVQMISDKHQLVRPNLLDLPDARKSVQAYQNYLTPREIEQNQEGVEESLVEESKIE